MANDYRKVARATDKRADKQLTEAIKNAKQAEINAEAYAQEAADTAEELSKQYADGVAGTVENNANDYTDTQVSNLQQQINDLEARVTALETA